jgi:NitT/TauT family transport system substrate-binding protein
MLRAVLSPKLLLSAALAIVATAAGAQGKGETVTIQDGPGTGTLPIRVAIAKGYCEKHGIRCELRTIPPGSLAVQALLAGTIDAAATATEIVIPAVTRGAKLKVIMPVSSRNIGLLVAGNHVDLPNAGKPFPAWVTDLKGRKVGVTARGSGVETGVRFLLEKAGLRDDDVTFVAVGGPNTAYPALTNRQVDFLMSFEPVGTLCEVTRQCKVLWRGDVDRQPAEVYATNGSGIGLVMTQAYVDAKPQVVQALIKASVEAGEFINNPANFEEVLKISETYFKFAMPEGDRVMRALLQRQIKVGHYDLHIKREAVKAAVDYMLTTGQWDKAVPVSELIDPRAP